MGCGSCIIKSVLILFNIITFLIGVVLVAAGCMVKFGSSFVQPYVETFFDALPDITKELNITDATSVPRSQGVSDLVKETMDIFDGVSIGLICVGAFLLIVGFLGCCGSCCMVKCMLICYVVVVFLILAGQIVLIVLFETGKLEEPVTSTLKDTIKDKYGGIDHYGAHSLVWNIIMTEFECCGVDNYKDFNGATKWKKTRTFANNQIQKTKTLVIPLACCKLDDTAPDMKLLDDDCGFQPTNNNSNWNEGCYDAIFDELEDYNMFIVISVIGVLVLELLMMILGIALINIHKNNERNRIHPVR